MRYRAGKVNPDHETDELHRAARGPAPTRLHRRQTQPVLGGDFTYVRTRSGFCYLALVVDLFSRRIVGSATAAGRILNSCSVPWSRRSDSARTIKVTSYTTGDHGSQYLSITYSDRGSWEGVDAFTGQVSSSYDYAAAEALSKPYERELIWTRS